MSATPHLGAHRRHHSHHHSPRNKSITADADSGDENELYKLFKAQRIAAKRSAEVSISLLREAENDTAEKIATRVTGGLAAGGGETAPAGGGSPSATAFGAPMLPTVETGGKHGCRLCRRHLSEAHQYQTSHFR